ncbi:MAG: fused MFS/spermidine synthase [Planctomycetales bacterium]
MTSSPSSRAERQEGAPPGVPWLLILFVGSGCAALIYEIVWFQMLELAIGSSAVSIAVLLGTFMGGMCLGSLALASCVSRRRHPLRVYAVLELGIGLCGLAVLYVMPNLTALYTAHVGSGLAGTLWRGVVAALGLAVPTALMGATLPAVARWVEASPSGMSWLGFLYGGNLAGAVLGCLLAGFYLLRVYDLQTAAWTSATINAAVALLALVLSWRTAYQPPEVKGQATLAASTPWSGTVYLSIGLSGCCALGAEVVWTRLLSLMLGGTVYTFSIILAVFLVGLGIGSSAGAACARRLQNPRIGLGLCQLLLGAAIAWTAWQLARSLPYWPINPALSSNPWLSFQLDLLRCAWGVWPAASLWGASFPLALAAASSGEDAGRLVGRVYAANTVGAIVGALAFSLSFIAWIGTQHSQQLLMGLSAVAGALVLIPLFITRPIVQTATSPSGSEGVALPTPPSNGRSWRRLAGLASLAAALVFMAWLAMRVPEVNGELIAYGRFLPYHLSQERIETAEEIIYQGEGLNSSVAVTRMATGVRNFHVSGKIEASSENHDMRLQRMLGHIPALLHPHPRTVLVVGCGAGVTAGSFVVHPEVERVVICELEPLIPQAIVPFFEVENHQVLSDRRVEVVYDDARHFILTTAEKFDIITSDPIHPWVKGAATLYTREYLELCRQRLNQGGIVTQWIPLYESNLPTVQSELATLFEVFPQSTIWSNDVGGHGYDVFVLGQTEPLQIDIDALQQRLAQDDHQPVVRSLHGVGMNSALDLLATYAGHAADLKEWLRPAEINHDRNLRLQYLAGFGLNLHREGMIYDDIRSRRTYPASMLAGSEASRLAVYLRMGFGQKE